MGLWVRVEEGLALARGEVCGDGEVWRDRGIT